MLYSLGTLHRHSSLQPHLNMPRTTQIFAFNHGFYARSNNPLTKTFLFDDIRGIDAHIYLEDVDLIVRDIGDDTIKGISVLYCEMLFDFDHDRNVCTKDPMPPHPLLKTGWKYEAIAPSHRFRALREINPDRKLR